MKNQGIEFLKKKNKYKKTDTCSADASFVQKSIPGGKNVAESIVEATGI